MRLVESINEYHLIWISALNGVIALMAAVFYSLGGRSGKWRRRFLAPGIVVLYCIGVGLYMKTGGRILWALLSYPLFAAGYAMGYGDNSVLMRIVRSKFAVRLISGMVYVGAGLPIVYSCGHYQLLLAALWMTPVVAYLGSKNPVPAAMEEFLICWITLFLLPFCFFVR